MLLTFIPEQFKNQDHAFFKVTLNWATTVKDTIGQLVKTTIVNGAPHAVLFFGRNAGGQPLYNTFPLHILERVEFSKTPNNPMKKAFPIRIIIACFDSNGSPTIVFTKVNVSEEDYKLGLHYDLSREIVLEAGYEDKMVSFDETELPPYLEFAMNSGLITELPNETLSKELFWNDPDPIPGNDYRVTVIRIKRDSALIQYGRGREAEVPLSELVIK